MTGGDTERRVVGDELALEEIGRNGGWLRSILAVSIFWITEGSVGRRAAKSTEKTALPEIQGSFGVASFVGYVRYPTAVTILKWGRHRVNVNWRIRG